jgi:hypothetical protein
MSTGATPRSWQGLAPVLALVAVVCSLTALQRIGAVPLASLAASPREVADGRLWPLVSNGTIAADPLLWSLLSFCILAFLTLALCGGRTLWFAALAGQAFSTVLGYSVIGLTRFVEPGAFQRLVSAPDSWGLGDFRRLAACNRCDRVAEAWGEHRESRHRARLRRGRLLGLVRQRSGPRRARLGARARVRDRDRRRYRDTHEGPVPSSSRTGSVRRIRG